MLSDEAGTGTPSLRGGAGANKNKTRYKTLDKLAKDPRVEEIWDEGANGIWVALVEGWNWDGCSCVHEWSVRDVLSSFKGITEGPTY
jgi:type IV secretory pathway ATPase VirB11/archaellum biosynthesis ATPase